MAIYRGPGGAGDAVADTDNQSEIAVTKAAEAAASATQSAASAAAASTSATNAANSASSASSSASTATSSASAASSAQTAAEAAQTAAETAETNAETAETNAETAETNATNSATAAGTSATNAANSATAASTSATNASNSATAAASSATSASNSATAAAASYDSFDDRYLGAKASAPATDNDGDALLTGALYYNTSANQLYIWDGAQWDQAAFSVAGTVASFNTRTGAVTLSSADVTTALGYTPVSTETDPVVGAITGIVKANGAGTIAAAVAGTDYLAPAAIGSTVLAYDSNLQSFVTAFTLPTTDGSTDQVLKTDGAGNIGFATVASGGGITFTKKTTTYTASADEGIIADTSGGAWTLTLPATPAEGDVVVVADGGNWGTNNLTVARNGSTIEGVAEDLTLDISGVSVELVYDGTTWQVYAQVGTGQLPTNNIDGGFAAAIYLTLQVINGGAANG